MRYVLDATQCRNYEVSSRREWLLTNGIGGFSMGTVSGANTRRYHGLLVAATSPPETRMVLLASMEISIQGQGNPIGLSCNQYSGAVHPEGYQFIDSFEVGDEAIWNFKASGMQLQKRLRLHPEENTCTITYTNTGTTGYELTLRPLVSHKFYHSNFRVQDDYPHLIRTNGSTTLIEHDGIPLYLHHKGAKVQPAVGWYYRFEHLRETDRGLDPRDDLFCPCELTDHLLPGESLTVVASTSPKAKAWSGPRDESDLFRSSVTEALKDAAKHFFVTSPTRTGIIAGYPWFTDWGRDTMISIPGLCLCTDRVEVARKIITDYASQMKQGLIPNRFVERGQQPEYNTVDATLWFAHAIHQTLEAEWNDEFAQSAFRSLEEVVKWHHQGTLYGIKVDPEDGLLRQGEVGVQLTWMDAKVGDWVVTPRHGKPVEINGLWVNALRVTEWLAEKLGKPSATYRGAAELAEKNFEPKFWKESLGYFIDTVDPDDASLRPNQVIAMSLPFGPAKGERARRALGVVSRDLLTPMGLRTLSPDDAAYHGRFRGPVVELDAAYHQGTVWPWLMGPYITALLKLEGDVKHARQILRQAREMLVEQGLGGLAEVYDGDNPRSPAGCPWQAWSVAEWLRAHEEVARARS